MKLLWKIIKLALVIAIIIFVWSFLGQLSQKGVMPEWFTKMYNAVNTWPGYIIDWVKKIFKIA